MRKLIPFILLLFSVGLSAQNALYNSSSIRIHDTGKMGIHTSLINNGSFDQNLGLAGFYGDTPATFSGAFVPIFYNMEIFKPSPLSIENSIQISNALAFVDGDIKTPKATPSINIHLNTGATNIGESNISKVNGYVSIENKQVYTFPVGDAEQLRILQLNSESINTRAKCAYFLENPNNPSSLTTSFNTNSKDKSVWEVSQIEFWRLEGNVASTVTISWNERSDVLELVDEIYKLGLVGWHKIEKKWIALSSIEPIGDEFNGIIQSDNFVPDDYEIITIAAIAVPTRLLELDNYLVTPNADGANDFLLIPELELSPNNSVRIFDRNGLKVFEKDNYSNEFIGFANTNNLVYKKKQGLPSGVYFYLAYLDDLKLEYQGFLYLSK